MDSGNTAGEPGGVDDRGVEGRIAALEERARRDREAFDPPDPPDEAAAMRYLREGFGPAVWCYVEARTNGLDHIPPDAFCRLERAMNDWLELYARCHGVRLDADFTVRTAAELLLETHDVRDTAQILTRVPARDGEAG